MGTRGSGNSHGTGEHGTLHGYVPADGKDSQPATAAVDTVAPVASNTSWDPYQVWLTRVKQPREQVALKRTQEQADAYTLLSADTSDTARLRALSPAVSR